MSYVRCIYYVTQTIQGTSLRSRRARTRAHEGKKRIRSVLYPLHGFTSRAIQKLTIKLTGSYHAGFHSTLGDKTQHEFGNKKCCSIYPVLRSVYIYLIDLFLLSHAHLCTYTSERRPPLVPEVAHYG